MGGNQCLCTMLIKWKCNYLAHVNSSFSFLQVWWTESFLLWHSAEARSPSWTNKRSRNGCRMYWPGQFWLVILNDFVLQQLLLVVVLSLFSQFVLIFFLSSLSFSLWSRLCECGYMCSLLACRKDLVMAVTDKAREIFCFLYDLVNRYDITSEGNKRWVWKFKKNNAGWILSPLISIIYGCSSSGKDLILTLHSVLNVCLQYYHKSSKLQKKKHVIFITPPWYASHQINNTILPLVDGRGQGSRGWGPGGCGVGGHAQGQWRDWHWERSSNQGERDWPHHQWHTGCLLLTQR